MYKASTPYYLCLFVEYDDSAVGYVGVPSSSFNANVSLKQNLKEIVPQDYWGYLEEKYGFRFVNSLLPVINSLACQVSPFLPVLYTNLWLADVVVMPFLYSTAFYYFHPCPFSI